MARRPAPIALLAVALVSCTDAPTFAAFVAYDDAHMSAGTGSGSGSDTENTSVSDSTSAEPSADTGTGSANGTEETSGAEDGSTAGEAELTPPRILAVDVPEMVDLAGPVAVTVTADHATAVRGTLDGVELELFEDQGGGVWLGHAPIFGAVDNGDHVVEVTATNGPLAHVWPLVSFAVKTPAPGEQAWALVAPSGTAKRGAVTADRELLEVGTVGIDGVLKPSIRKRSAINGAELWPEGTIVLDDREGSADAIAVVPDGRVWVALNVKNPSKKWQPRIVQLDTEGHATGIEVPTEPGATVRGLAADAEGVVAVGFDGSGFGDMDVVTWRCRHDGTPVYSAKRWDYVPPVPGFQPHVFDDFAFDVMLIDGIAWVVGMSEGPHEINIYRTGGLIVQLDLATGTAAAPAMIAEPVKEWRNSSFFAGAPHPDGVVAVGNESTDGGTMQQITVQAFATEGVRTYYLGEWPATVAYGTGVVVNAHGLVLASGVVHDGDGLRGVLYGRGKSGANFDYLFPGLEGSAANGVALDDYEQAYVFGERILGGMRQARTARLHQ